MSPCRTRILLFTGIALLLSSSLASAAPVSAPTTTIKRFTGILSGSGPVTQSPGQPLSPTAEWVDFICDPLSLNWRIQVVHLGPFLPTYYLNGPRICDHVEILMLYYNPEIPAPGNPGIGLVDGTAIYIMKI
jgi:hypothetical protein